MPAAEEEEASSTGYPLARVGLTTAITCLIKGDGGVKGPGVRRAETTMSPDPILLTNMKRWGRKVRTRVNRAGLSRYKTLILWINSLTFCSVVYRITTSVRLDPIQELSSSFMTLKLTTMSRVTIRSLRHTEVYSIREQTFL